MVFEIIFEIEAPSQLFCLLFETNVFHRPPARISQAFLLKNVNDFKAVVQAACTLRAGFVQAPGRLCAER